MYARWTGRVCSGVQFECDEVQAAGDADRECMVSLPLHAILEPGRQSLSPLQSWAEVEPRGVEPEIVRNDLPGALQGLRKLFARIRQPRPIGVGRMSQGEDIDISCSAVDHSQDLERCPTNHDDRDANPFCLKNLADSIKGALGVCGPSDHNSLFY